MSEKGRIHDWNQGARHAEGGAKPMPNANAAYMAGYRAMSHPAVKPDTPVLVGGGVGPSAKAPTTPPGAFGVGSTDQIIPEQKPTPLSERRAFGANGPKPRPPALPKPDMLTCSGGPWCGSRQPVEPGAAEVVIGIDRYRREGDQLTWQGVAKARKCRGCV